MQTMPVEQPSREDRQTRFLRLFLASERELYRYVAVLVPNVTDAEDIVQQTAVQLWKKSAEYDPAQPFTPWACRFALNIVRQWAAYRQRGNPLLFPGLAETLLKRREELRATFEGRLAHLDQCLDKLPIEQQALVQGYYFQRRDIAQLAADSRRSIESVYKTLQRIRSLLRKCIEHAAQSGESAP